MELYKYLGFSKKELNSAFLKTMKIMFREKCGDTGTIAKNLFKYVSQNVDKEVLLILVLATVALFLKANDTQNLIQSLIEKEEE